jgi:thioredoxin reductase (NADPH)
VLFGDGAVLKLDALYVGFGVRVRSELAAALGARLDRAGYIEVDKKQHTTVPGLYAAGDVVQSLSQISVAFGQAAIAASAINISLNDERWPEPNAD